MKLWEEKARAIFKTHTNEKKRFTGKDPGRDCTKIGLWL